jgi:hypothetical protein
MGKSESPIQTYVLQRLELLERQGKCYYFRNNSFTGRVMRHNGTQGYIKNSKRGMPDVVACIKGLFIGIECKAKGNYQSPDQKAAERMIEGVGGQYWLVRTPDEFEQYLVSILTKSPTLPHFDHDTILT